MVRLRTFWPQWARYMPMILSQLVKLNILQKNKLENPAIPFFRCVFDVEFRALTKDVGIVAEEVMAPALFAGQPKIPFVLFKPKAASPQTLQPLIIHTHGGPHVYMEKTNCHN